MHRIYFNEFPYRFIHSKYSYQFYFFQMKSPTCLTPISNISNKENFEYK